MYPFGACGRKPKAPFAIYEDSANPEPASKSSSHALSNRMPNTADLTDSKPKASAVLSKTRSSHEVTQTADQPDLCIMPGAQPGPLSCTSPGRASPLRSLTSNDLRSSGGAVRGARLRRYRTEPYLLALREELKKESGVTPRTPLKHDNPFEPHDLPLAMSRKWASSALETEGPSQSGTGHSAPWAWSIDHMAALQPVDIPHQDVLHTELLKHVVSDSDEEVAQANIRRFFADDAVHPLTPTPDSKRWPAARSDDEDSDEEGPVHAGVVRSKSYTIARPQPAAGERCDAATQTDIHIPAALDFSRYLADLRMRRETTGWPRRRQSARGSVRRRLFADEQENAPLQPALEAPTFGILEEVPAPPEMDVSMGFHCAD